MAGTLSLNRQMSLGLISLAFEQHSIEIVPSLARSAPSTKKQKKVRLFIVLGKFFSKIILTTTHFTYYITYRVNKCHHQLKYPWYDYRCIKCISINTQIRLFGAN